MLAEYLMYRFGWETVWMPGVRAEKNDIPRRPFDFFRSGECFVGTWTGPDSDLLCVRRCKTLEEAEMWLSPPGHTILGATLKALLLRMRGPRMSPDGNPSKESHSSKPYLAHQTHPATCDELPSNQELHTPSALDSTTRGAYRAE